MSDKRLGGIENSSLRYFSAMRALDVSMSRIVKPSFSRKVRRLLPAGSIWDLRGSGGNHLKVPAIIANPCKPCHKFVNKFHRGAFCYEIRTYKTPRICR